MTSKYLVDVNLPYRFSLWNSNEYLHQSDINNSASDEEIWNYAQINNLTIISKDADFSTRIRYSEPPPNVIHIRLGNMSIKELHRFLDKIWSEIVVLNNEYKLINIFIHGIECIK